MVSVWRSVQRTPLVLPGNPALSEDVVRKRISPARIAIGSLAGSALLLGTMYLLSPEERGDEPVSSVAGETTPGPDVAESQVLTPPADVPSPLAATDSVARDSAAMSRLAIASAATEIAAAPPLAPPSAAPPVAIPAPPPVTATSAAPKPAPAVAVAAPIAPTIPVLRLAPLVSESLRTGELLRLRWTVRDRSTNRELPGRIEFTTTDPNVAVVDRVTGTVTARKPGRVRIIADAGAAGETEVNLVVRAAAPPPTLVAAATGPLEVRSEAARSASIAPAAPVVASPLVSAPATTPAPVTSPVPSSASPLRDRRDESPNATDVRTAVDRLVGELRRGRANNLPLMEFLADGAGHRITLLGTPSTIGATSNVVRISFELRMTKFDGGGRPVTRIAPVTMDVEKRDATVTASEVSVGALRKP